jgi:hypothetical protein
MMQESVLCVGHHLKILYAVVLLLAVVVVNHVAPWDGAVR